MTQGGFSPGVIVTMDICALAKPRCACARLAPVLAVPVIINDVDVCLFLLLFLSDKIKY